MGILIVLIGFLAAIIAILMVKIIFLISENKDPMYRMFIEKGFNSDNMYGLTQEDKKKLKRLRNESFLIFAFSLVIFFLIIVNNNM